jgi:hypothetical protein
MLFNPRCLQDHSGNSADTLPTRYYYNLLPTIGLVCRWSLGKTISLYSWGPHKFPNSSWTPLMTLPTQLSMKQLDWSAPMIPTKGWNVRFLAFLGQVEDPKASTKTRPPDLWSLVSPLLVSLPDCFLACKTTQELPVTQLARHVDLFHLVITDNQKPEALSLPHGLAPPIKPTTHFSQASSLWTQKSDSPAVWFLMSLSFPHVAWSLFGSSLQKQRVEMC